MRIAFVISALGAGGAERVAATLCNAWSAAGHEVHLLTYLARGTPSHFAIDPRVALHPLDLLKSSESPLAFLANNLVRIRALRRRFVRLRPDVIVSFTVENNVIAVLATRGLGIPVIVAERTHPAHYRIGRVREFLRDRTYPLADGVVVQTQGVWEWMRRSVGVDAAVLPNPIDLARFAALPPAGSGQGRRKRLLAIGRMSAEKGLHTLVDAFASVAGRHREWDLRICGDGPMRAEVERRIAASGVAERIQADGVVSDVVPELAAADLYVLPSVFEGYPNALVEALAAGRCCVASECGGPAREILRDGTYGLLAGTGTAGALAAALDTAMSDDALRAGFAARAREAVADCDVAVVSARWIALFHSAIANRRSGSRGGSTAAGARASASGSDVHPSSGSNSSSGGT